MDSDWLETYESDNRGKLTAEYEQERSMEFKKVTAIVRTDVLKEVENRLKQLDVPGITVTRVKRFGEYANFLTPRREACRLTDGSLP